MPDAAPPPSAAKVPLPIVLAFSSIGMPIAVIGLLYTVYLPPNYVALGVSFLDVAFAITIVRCIDAFLDPTLAVVMDRVRTPIGRYRPWVVAGVPIAMLGVFEIFMPPAHVTQLYFIVWLIVSFAGLSMMTLGQSAWSSAVAVTYHDRARLFAWISLLGVLATVAILLLPVFTGGKVSAGLTGSMPTIGWILLISMPICLALCALATPDRGASGSAPRPKFTLADYRKAIGRPSMMRLILSDFVLNVGPGTTGPLYLFYFHDAKGFSIQDISVLLIFYVAAGILGSLFWGGPAAKWFGKHRALQISCVAYSVTQTILMAVPRMHGTYGVAGAAPTAIAMMGVGFCASAFVILNRAMVADVADEVKLEQKQDLTSLLFSMVTTTTKVGSSITVAIVYPVLAWVGYNGAEGAVNTPHAIFGLQMCYLFAPITLVWVGGGLLFGYKLDSKRHAEIRDALTALDFAAAEESLTGLPIPPPEAVAAPAT
ncbi:MAG TPA: MFS transporter [Caulobacteraceae bacterium]|nr:MFS transporter [Caulobacteraceae bacterium]